MLYKNNNSIYIMYKINEIGIDKKIKKIIVFSGSIE